MKKYFLLILFILIGVVLFFISYDLVLYRIWVNIISPHPFKVILPKPRQYTSIPNTDYFRLEWSDDGQIINLYRSDMSISSDEPASIYRLDVRSGTIIDVVQDYPKDSSNLTFNLRNAIRVTGDDETDWVKCLHGDVAVSVDRLKDDNHQLSLYQGETLSATFNFSPFNPEYAPGYRGIHFMSFAPKCDYLTLTFDGWAYYEGNAREELWLLDVSKKTLNPIVIGYWPLVRAADYPVQSLRADWSPDGQRLVFGDEWFGLEIFNLNTSTRSRLANLRNSGWDPKWSASGKWIAAEQWFRGSVIVLAENRKSFAVAGKCSHIIDFEWSPINDQLAYLCYDMETHTDSFWIWEVSPNKK